jgi:hypothetical protein
MRGDRKLVEESAETLALLSKTFRQVQMVLRDAARWRSETPPEIGEWRGERVDNQYDDFPHRYLFAFWRLAAQGTTTADSAPAAPRRARGNSAKPAGDPEVRVVRLAATTRSDKSRDHGTAAVRLYHHRWPVRMHKVRQWYPSLNAHRVIWRGPYIKGPAGAPLMIGEKAYSIDT